jgi:hypothetical protein
MPTQQSKVAPAFTLPDASGSRQVMQIYVAYGEKMMYSKKTVGVTANVLEALQG